MYRHYGHEGSTITQQSVMTDQDIITDVLSSLKHISYHYHLSILEANTHDTRQAFLNLHDYTLDQHKNAVETMKSQGWYQPEMAIPRYQ